MGEAAEAGRLWGATGARRRSCGEGGAGRGWPWGGEGTLGCACRSGDQGAHNGWPRKRSSRYGSGAACAAGGPLSHPPPPRRAARPARRRPGAEQQAWVQSQTTFAALHREEDGSWGVRCAKQKIWVEGVSYELQARAGLLTVRPRLGGGRELRAAGAAGRPARSVAWAGWRA